MFVCVCVYACVKERDVCVCVVKERCVCVFEWLHT